MPNHSVTMNLKSPTRKRHRSKHQVDLSALLKQTSSNDTFLASCFGNGNKGTFSEGVRMFVDITRDRMLAYESTTGELMSTFPVSHPEHTYLDRQMELSTHIVNSVRSMTAQRTIDEIVDRVYVHYKIDTATSRPHENAIRHLVFATIGWSTMLYTAACESVDADFSTNKGSTIVSAATRGRLAHSSGRPIGTLLRTLELIPLLCPLENGPAQGLSTLLAVTHLNFFSLAKLGDVTITWTNDLAKHCVFERHSKDKTLWLFRLPSVCARICLSDEKESLFGRICKSHDCSHTCQTRAMAAAIAYLDEVLLSYRLLFGQHDASRKLFRAEERDKAASNHRVDPLLDTLCGDGVVNDSDGTKERLRERGVYNASTNFPNLGARLMELADYSKSQRPRNLREVWNDQRDPEKLLTFKAVVIIGGIIVAIKFSN